tara:strand:+ start:89 stop:2131 length:2043 start_codon:yes stop_codon:yes gene_type:complete
MNRFNKIFHHIKSKKIDEKIEYLNKELKKTGVVFESGPTMTTGSLYQLHTFVPTVPEESTDVPDSTGFIAGTSTQDANGGNVSDSNTWNNGWNNVSDMQNSNDIGGETDRNIPFTPDLSGWDGSSTSANASVIFGGERGEGMTQPTSATGIAVYSGDQGQRCIGSLGAGNKFVQILVGDAVFGSYTYPSEPKGGYYSSYSNNEFTAARNLAAAYEDNKSKGSVTRKVWVPFDTANNGASYAAYSGAKKTTTRYTSSTPDGAPVYWALKDVSILTGQRTTYVTQDYVPSYTLLTQHGLDDPSYYPGNPNKFMDFLKDSLDVGDKGLDYLNDKIIEEEVGELKSIENEATEEEKAEWQERMADLDETIERTGSELKAARDEMKALALDFGMDVANVLGAFATGGLSTVPAIIKTVGKKVGGGLLRRLLNKFKTKSQKKADRKDFAQRMRDEMSGKTTKKSNQFNPDVLGTNYGDKTHTGGISGYTGSRNLRNSYKPQGKLIAEGLNTPIPIIKVSKKDLIRSSKLTKDEVDEMIGLVDSLNNYIKRNPDQLAYARQRYPKSDPRLAALNYKLDMQLAAADEYVETRFPENERLFDRLLARAKHSIKLTDPKTYENNNGKLITFNKLARVDDNYQPRKIKVKKKTKMSQGKLFLLPDRKKKDDILKDKMAVLDKEIQKTMPDM